MEENYQVNNPTDTRLNNVAKGFLKEIAKWANFFAILGFIGIGLLVLVALFAGVIFSSLPGNNIASSIGGGVITFIYLLMAVLYFFPVLYLYKFSTKMKAGLARNNEDELTEAFSNLKSHYKFVGILTIIMLSFYALGILLALMGGLASM